MKVSVLNESGYDESALGFSLSYNSTPERAKQLFPVFAFKQGGENKFLESIYVWLDIDAPRFWWSEADTYRISSKQSESTMHTLAKKKVVNADFEYPVWFFERWIINYYIAKYNKNKIGIEELKSHLPEGFLQRRVWCMSYKTLQNIYNQRKNHRLPQWHYFLDEVLKQIQHPEFIVKSEKKENIPTQK